VSVSVKAASPAFAVVLLRLVRTGGTP